MEGLGELYHVHFHVAVVLVPVYLGRRLHIEHILQSQGMKVLVGAQTSHDFRLDAVDVNPAATCPRRLRGISEESFEC